MNTTLTAVIEREDDLYVALCPEFDVVSQGVTVREARENLREALELFFEEAPPEEQERQYRAARDAAPGASSGRFSPSRRRG